MPRSRSTTASSGSRSRPSSLFKDDGYDDADEGPSVPVETLVEHLLAARRALGTIAQVLRGNELATEARALHVETVVCAAQTAFLRRGIREQVRVLLQVRRGLGRAYDEGRRDFRSLIRTLDAANGQLEHTLDILRATTVASVFRPAGEAPRTLLDFVDEAGVETLRDAIKQSIAVFQDVQTSFDGDLLRFDTDLRTLSKAMAAAPPPPPPLPVTARGGAEAVRQRQRRPATDDREAGDDDYEAGEASAFVPDALVALTQHSRTMAEDLASLTRHFDLCVTAVRTTEGGLALARWKAESHTSKNASNNNNNASASSSRSEDGAQGAAAAEVSISGVIAEQDAADSLVPLSAAERAEMLQVVLQDAAEVDGVVAEIGAALHEAEAAFAEVQRHAEQTRAAHAATVAALGVVEEMGGRLRSYAAAEREFAERWVQERAEVAERLEDMDGLRRFYEGYAHAYDTLILEAERRRTVEARIQTVWRKARDAVARLVEADHAAREGFRQDVGAFLPTDLWVDMDRPPRGADLFFPAAAAPTDAAAGAGTGAATTDADDGPAEYADYESRTGPGAGAAAAAAAQQRGSSMAGARRHEPANTAASLAEDPGAGGSSTRTAGR